jgi:PPM family protein phosphatase
VTSLGRSTLSHVVTLPEHGGQIELSWHAATHTGNRRAANEDSYIADAPIFAVADGMGGHAHGDRASDAVVRRLQAVMGSDFVDSDAIVDALRLATVDIGELDEDEHGIGTTVTGVALGLREGGAYFTVFNVGDSRVYSLVGTELRQITIDHSMVQELIDAGQLSAADAERHPEASVITRAVGFSIEPEIDFVRIPVEPGMRLLICSDGLTREVAVEEIQGHVTAGARARETAEALVEAALEGGGRDNITVIVLDIVGAPEPRD